MSSTNYSIQEILKIVKGKTLCTKDDNEIITDILIDSRRLINPDNCLFFALSSKKNNGHDFIEELYQKGIRNFIVSEEDLSFGDANIIFVENTLEALQKLIAYHRNQFDIPVFGITGSNGKTIIKEWLFQLLSPDKKIIRSPKSYNSQVGVPLSVWQMKPGYDMAIFEAGISEPDEMGKLQPIINPTIGIFTNIGAAHSENFITTKQKVGEKLKLFTKVDTLIYCSDYPEIQETIIKSEILESINAFTWSRKQEADFRINSTEKNPNNTSRISGIFKGEEISILIPFVDDASIENAIHCWASMLYLNYEKDVIAVRMLNIQAIAMRLEMKEGINHCSIINDSYNSDINSLSIAIDFLNQQNQHKRKTIILSDILQSGQSNEDLYGEIAGLLDKKGIHKIIGIGKAISNQADKFAMEKTFFPNTEDFLHKCSFTIFQNESILLKGARVFEFERISKALQQKAHETIFEVNLNALIHNLNYFRSKTDPDTKIMAMVKAFSYGSGSFEIANILQFHRVDYLAVAYADEGVELRKAGITLPIMVMNPDEQSFDAIIKHNLEPEIYNFRSLKLLEKAIRKNIIPDNKPIKTHIKFDTGLHRLGFELHEMEELINLLKDNKHIYVQSVFSHLAASEDPKEDDFTHQQIDLFREMSDRIKSHTGHPVFMHILNSAGISRFPEAQFDMVRLGISLYGISSNPTDRDKLENVSTLKSTISQIKMIKAGETIGYNRVGIAKEEMKIAVVAIGFADGFSRSLSNGVGNVLIHGKFAPVVGNISMDLCMVDITGIDAKEGDDVVIFGEDFPLTKMAKATGTIPYEIMTGISRRVKRIYFQE